MAVCNLFKTPSDALGHFYTFSQYTDDLSKCFVQHDNYDVIPSAFIALNLGWSGANSNGCTSLLSNLQNKYENACATLKDWVDTNSNTWNAIKDWNPEVSAHLFWNTIFSSAADATSKMVYAGDIDIHSYEEYGGTGYSEIYCYIPEDASSQTFTVQSSSRKDLAIPINAAGKCSGYQANVTGTIEQNPSRQAYPIRSLSFNKYYDITGVAPAISANNGRSIVFNAIVVLYDIMVKSVETGKQRVLYKNIPMGIYITPNYGTPITKATSAVNYSTVGTAYGLRICTRYMAAPNAAATGTVKVDSANQYAGFSRAMAAMAQSQQTMNDMVERIATDSQGWKNALQALRNDQVNVPYLKEIGGKHYWFINGKNTGMSSDGKDGKDGDDGTQISLIQGEGGVSYWVLDGHVTDVRASGQDGHTPSITVDDSGYIYVDGINIGQRVKGDPGEDGHTPVITYSSENDSFMVDGEPMQGGIGIIPKFEYDKTKNVIKFWEPGDTSPQEIPFILDASSVGGIITIGTSNNIYIGNKNTGVNLGSVITDATTEYLKTLNLGSGNIDIGSESPSIYAVVYESDITIGSGYYTFADVPSKVPVVVYLGTRDNKVKPGDWFLDLSGYGQYSLQGNMFTMESSSSSSINASYEENLMNDQGTTYLHGNRGRLVLSL